MEERKPPFLKLAELGAFIREVVADPEKFKQFYTSLPRPTCRVPAHAERLGHFSHPCGREVQFLAVPASCELLTGSSPVGCPGLYEQRVHDYRCPVHGVVRHCPCQACSAAGTDTLNWPWQ